MFYARGHVAGDSGLRVRGVVIQEAVVGGGHLAVLGGVVFVSESLGGVGGAGRGGAADALFEVEDGEGADVAEAVDVDGEFAEEVDDAVAAFGEGEPEDEGGEYDAQNFFEEDDNLHLVELGELALDFVGVQAVFPLLRHVVRVVDDVPECVFGVEDLVVGGNGAVGNGP